MASTTQYNPQAELNRILLEAGVSRTVYALVTPETEAAKAAVLGNALSDDVVDLARATHLEQFRDAWTGKQDRLHREFFDTWHTWSAPLVALDRGVFQFSYPTAGASEPLRHLIYDYGNIARAEGLAPRIHIFKGEYEGYKAYAEAARIEVVEHDRRDWRQVAGDLPESEWFFLSQPSAIDGNVWPEANMFLRTLSTRSDKPHVIMDMTYVGAIADVQAERFAVSEPCVRNVVFSLSKPFGVYYDRIGGVFSREQDLGLFGNMWFKSLMALQLGTALMRRHDVFALARKYRPLQIKIAQNASEKLGINFGPADIYMLATAPALRGPNSDLADYLRRPASDASAKLRLCLTPAMAKAVGTAGPVRGVISGVDTSPERGGPV